MSIQQDSKRLILLIFDKCSGYTCCDVTRKNEVETWIDTVKRGITSKLEHTTWITAKYFKLKFQKAVKRVIIALIRLAKSLKLIKCAADWEIRPFKRIISAKKGKWKAYSESNIVVKWLKRPLK